MKFLVLVKQKYNEAYRHKTIASSQNVDWPRWYPSIYIARIVLIITKVQMFVFTLTIFRISLPFSTFESCTSVANGCRYKHICRIFTRCFGCADKNEHGSRTNFWGYVAPTLGPLQFVKRSVSLKCQNQLKI